MAKTCKKINVFNSQHKHVLKPPFIMGVTAGCLLLPVSWLKLSKCTGPQKKNRNEEVVLF